LKPAEKHFLNGFADAVHWIVVLHDVPTIAASIIAANALTLAEFKSARVDPVYMRTLKRLYRTERQLRDLRGE